MDGVNSFDERRRLNGGRRVEDGRGEETLSCWSRWKEGRGLTQM
jgi:hypothetical protein